MGARQPETNKGGPEMAFRVRIRCDLSIWWPFWIADDRIQVKFERSSSRSVSNRHLPRRLAWTRRIRSVLESGGLESIIGRHSILDAEAGRRLAERAGRHCWGGQPRNLANCRVRCEVDRQIQIWSGVARAGGLISLHFITCSKRERNDKQIKRWRRREWAAQKYRVCARKTSRRSGANLRRSGFEFIPCGHFLIFDFCSLLSAFDFEVWIITS